MRSPTSSPTWPRIAPPRSTAPSSSSTAAPSRPSEVIAPAFDEWFSGADERHSIHEDSRRITEDPVLSILCCTNEEALEAIVERDEGACPKFVYKFRTAPTRGIYRVAKAAACAAFVMMAATSCGRET